MSRAKWTAIAVVAAAVTFGLVWALGRPSRQPAPTTSMWVAAEHEIDRAAPYLRTYLATSPRSKLSPEQWLAEHSRLPVATGLASTLPRLIAAAPGASGHTIGVAVEVRGRGCATARVYPHQTRTALFIGSHCTPGKHAGDGVTSGWPPPPTS